MAKNKKIYDPLATARTKPKTVKTLALNPAAARNAGLGEFEPYRAFPPELFACTNLEELEVFRGIAYDGDARLPARIGELTKLTKLSLGGIGFTELPAEIGKLVKLRTLELYYADALRALPKAIGKLSELRELQCGYCESLATLPAEIGKLRELRVFGIGNTKLREVPRELWKCTKLTTLYLHEGITRLPPGIAALSALESLVISAKATASIASELPLLPSLKSLHVVGKATKLPVQIGELVNLVELDVAFLGLDVLPPLTKLSRLEQLDVSGNKLTTVIPLIEQLPKLVSLSYSDNPVTTRERRSVDALMKLAPAKRKLSVPTPPAGRAAKAKLVGKVSSINASLTMVAGDASVIARWRGIGDGDDLDGSDWDRARIISQSRRAATIDCAGKSALVVDLGMGCGVAEVFRIDTRLVLVEGIGEYLDDELFLEWAASPLVKGAKAIGVVALPTKTLALLPSTDAGTAAPKLAADKVEKFGDDNCGRAIGFGHASARLSIEPPVASSWGNARRCIIEPI